MRFIIFGIIFLSSAAHAFLEQSCEAVALQNHPSYKGIDINFLFKKAAGGNQTLEIKVFRDGLISREESETFVNLELTDNFPSPGSIKISSSDLRLRIYAKRTLHPITGELQLPQQGYIRWVNPLTVGLESVVSVSCPFN